MFKNKNQGGGGKDLDLGTEQKKQPRGARHTCNPYLTSQTGCGCCWQGVCSPSYYKYENVNLECENQTVYFVR